MALLARHIQDFDNASALERHWGYVDRVLPCTSDAGSCQYLDVVYSSHDRGVLYSAILWAIILGILLISALSRVLRSQSRSHDAQQQGSSLGRLWATVRSSSYKALLPQVPGLRASRLQVAVLAILLVYLLVFSFVGMWFNTWITPVKGRAKMFQKRSSIGPFADRIGILAYALTPLSILLSSRESVLSLLTGIPSQSFLFLHAWIGRVIFVQSLVHAIMWSVVEGVNYQPQPTVYNTWIVQLYMIFGIVAMFLISVLFVFSFNPVIKVTGYEVFRKVHYVTAVLYIAMCWGHWWQLSCWMIASFAIYGLDRAIRFLRFVEVHLGHADGKTLLGFRPLKAKCTPFEDVKGHAIRLQVQDTRNVSWKPGQHFYLNFPQLSIWQSHPFTALSTPDEKGQYHDMEFLIRCESGETAKLLDWVRNHEEITVILSGPYGASVDRSNYRGNAFGIAAGTGITYTLPRLAQMAMQNSPAQRPQLVWIIPDVADLDWIQGDLARISLPPYSVAIHVFVTRGTAADAEKMTGADAPAGVKMTILDNQHPDLHDVLEDLLNRTADKVSRTHVVASGPGGMLEDLRAAVAACNKPGRIWATGEMMRLVDLDCDSRSS